MSQKKVSTVLTEAVIVGLLLIPFTYATGFAFSGVMKKPVLPDVCKTWNRHYVMEINLFLSGFFFHLAMEYLGINRWYASRYPESYTPLSGIRENCEDIICADCSAYANDGNWPSYMACKKACFEDRKDDIDACCADTCGDNAYCLESCQPLRYGS